MDRGESVWLPPLSVVVSLKVAIVVAVAAVAAGGLVVCLGLLMFA